MKPIILALNDTVSRWPCGKYFVRWYKDEILLRAKTDAAAIEEGAKVLEKLRANNEVSHTNTI